MTELSPVSGARIRPSGSRKETRIWLFMRISGLALFVLALAHFSILHFIFDPADQTAEFIANERWNRVAWRAFDWLMLMLVLAHSFLGIRTVVGDHVSGRRLRPLVLWALGVLAVVLFALGTWVVLWLPGKAAG